MQVKLTFYSYFAELAGCRQAEEIVPEGCKLGELYQRLSQRFPKLAVMEKSSLMAVGVDYQPRDYVLKDGDEVALFPPVQGG
jgi:molybdopterin converting factor small subunit